MTKTYKKGLARLKFLPSKNLGGFTLIELLVVIAIIGILSTLAVVSLGNARVKARDAKRLADMRTTQSALEIFYTDRASYPASTASGTTCVPTTTLEDCYLCNIDGGGWSSNPCTDATTQLIRIPRDPSSNSGNTEANFDYIYSASGASPSAYYVGFTYEGASPPGGLVQSTTGVAVNCLSTGGMAADAALAGCP